MHHSYLDKYARKSSIIHALDARVKLLLTILFLLSIAAFRYPHYPVLIVICVWILVLCTLAKIPLQYLLIRSLVVVPFAGMVALSYAFTFPSGEVYWQWGFFSFSSGGLEQASLLLLRAWLAVCLMVLLINTCPFDELLNALQAFRVPALLILLLSFTYRFIYLFWDEAERMQRARDLRYFGGQWSRQLTTLGYLVSALFLRSYWRAERVHAAMLLRAWEGTPPKRTYHRWSPRDWWSAGIGLVVIICLWILQYEKTTWR
ncbi:MAG: cobalt ECF transporter T component CbiQ [bacterium]